MSIAKKYKWDENLRKDIIEWDVRNWGKVIDFIEDSQLEFKEKSVLELGARNGGLSLYYALKGAKVLCSDLNGPTKKAQIGRASCRERV